jgi:hypothetical protein
MNAEQLEKWAESCQFWCYESRAFVIRRDDLRALFAGKVLVPVSLLQKKVISGFSDEYSIAFHDGRNELIDEIAASQEHGK